MTKADKAIQKLSTMNLDIAFMVRTLPHLTDLLFGIDGADTELYSQIANIVRRQKLEFWMQIGKDEISGKKPAVYRHEIEHNATKGIIVVFRLMEDFSEGEILLATCEEWDAVAV